MACCESVNRILAQHYSLNFPVSAWMLSKTKSEKSTRPLENLILITISYQIIIILGESVLLGGFELGNGDLGVFGVKEKFLGCRYDKELILYEIHELLVELFIRHA